MNPLTRFLQYNPGPAVPPPVEGLPDQLEGYGANLTSPKYYTNTYPFINLVRQGTVQGSSATNADGWPINIAPGASVVVAVAFSLDTLTGYFPPGNYIATTASGLHCTMSSASGCTNVVNGTGPSSPTASFTVANLGSAGVYSVDIRVTVRNGTAATVALMDDLYIGLASLKTSYDNGAIFDPGFLSDLAGIKMLRFSDWNGLNGGQNSGNVGLYIGLDPSMLSTESNMCWMNDYNQGVPYSVCAKLCKELDCVMWFCADLGDDYRFCYGADAATDLISTWEFYGDLSNTFNHPFAENDEVVLWGFDNDAPGGLSWGGRYFVQRESNTTFRLRNSFGGSTINITASRTKSFGLRISKVPVESQYTAFYNAVVAQIFDAWPSARVVGQVGLENWNSGYNYHFDRGVLCNAATGTSGDAGIGYVWAQLQLWKAIEAVAERSQNIRMLEGQAASFTPLSSALTYVDPGFVVPGQQVKTFMDCYAVAPYIFPMENGIQVAMPSNAAATWTDAQWLASMQEGVDIIKNDVIFERNRMLAVAPGMRFCTYEGGHTLALRSPSAAQRATVMRFMEWLGSAAGGVWAQYFIDEILIGCGFSNHAQYTSASGWTTDQYAGCWGLKRAHQLPDTPYSTAFKHMVLT